MKKFLLLTILLDACYTKTKHPDYNFMSTVAQQAALDSGLMTTIELSPAKFYFGKIRDADSLNGYFFIKNTGQRLFNIQSFYTGCSCIRLHSVEKMVEPGDSMAVYYTMKLPNKKGVKANSIVVIGNCPAGNKTYYFEVTIF